ncbi:MAG: hypothetical protein E7336_10925 [Clostridiales bacterium]|nr:hypothetical protein [Clostridiales bacterium]
MINYLLLLVAVFLLAVDSIFRKKYQEAAGSSMKAGLMFNILVGFTAALFFWIFNGFKWESTPFSQLMGIAQALMGVAYAIIGFKVMKEGGVALYALFLTTGSMVVPYVWGLLFLGESFSWLRMAGLLIIIVAVFITKVSDFKANPKQMLLCVAVFFFNGLVGVISKVHQVEVNYPVVSAAAFTVLVNFWKMALSGAAYGAMFKKLREQPKLPPLRKTYPYVVGCTMTGGIYYILQLLVAGKVSASVMFPMMTGGNIIFSALLGKAILHENLSKRAIIGIILCFVGTCMFL